MRRINNMPPEERFTRTVFGVVLVLATFISWGQWIAFVLGILFLISAWQGYCATCELYKKINKAKSA